MLGNCGPINILTKGLFTLNPKLPICPCHYTTGKNLVFFTSLAQIENTLSCATCSCKNMFKTLGNRDVVNEVNRDVEL